MLSSISAAHAFNIHLHGLVVRRAIFQVPGKARSAGSSFLILSTKGTCVPLSSFLCLALTLNLFTYINIYYILYKYIFSYFPGKARSAGSSFLILNTNGTCVPVSSFLCLPLTLIFSLTYLSCSYFPRVGERKVRIELFNRNGRFQDNFHRNA